jgi:hypothetical protein
MVGVGALSDIDAWNATVPSHLDSKLWPFVLQSILWRLWDARNGAIFRNDFVIWQKHFRSGQDVSALNAWRHYLLSCNNTSSSTPVDVLS